MDRAARREGELILPRRIFLRFLSSLAILAAASSVPAAAATPPAVTASGGSVVRISWNSRPADAREWEAFLSLDGGRNYPIRLTPHLDRSILFFEWSVPAGIVSESARVRIRSGDEKIERDWTLPDVLAVAPEAGRALLTSRAADLGKTPFHGEEASVLWVDGPRDGRGAHPVSPATGPGMTSPPGLESAAPLSTMIMRERVALSPPETARATLAGEKPPALQGSPAPTRSPLNLTSRLNI